MSDEERKEKKREYQREYMRKWRNDNREKVRADGVQYWRDHPFKRLANAAHTRQKKRGLAHLPKPSEHEIEEVWVTGGGECPICGRTIVLHATGGSRADDQAELDAVVPALGYQKGNMAFLCHPCNRRKDNSSWQWVEKLYHYLLQHMAKSAA